VRFVPGKIHRDKPPKECDGPKTVVEQGHFVGVITFRGEGGFSEVRAHRARGEVPASRPSSAHPSAPSRVRRRSATN
jgi:hypothetical protein